MCGARRRRRVGFQPNFLYFEPRAGGRGFYNPESEKILKVEELESIRLKDYLQMDQAEAAKRMGVSQPTFHRIITEAHRKIAEAFVEGKAIRVEGGNYVIAEATIEAPVPPPKMPPGWGGKGRRRGGGRDPLAPFKSQE
jgi:predicted DNA-binding protein (UPF0251 family)